MKPWDAKGYKMPGGAPYSAPGFPTFVGASAMVHGKTMGVYPAARALLAAVYEGALVPFDTALRIEARHFTSVLMNPSSSAMIRSLFINKEALDKGANRPKVADQAVKKLGVIGAGMMGAGIAYVSANAGIEVVLIDSTQEAADRGRAQSEAILDKGIKRGKVTAEKKAEVLARIAATTDYAALKGVDLVVEAVFEDPKVKAEVTAKVEAAVGPDCIYATNTSTLPITGLAAASERPEQFIGIHFMNPVPRMQLVELIRGIVTEDDTFEKARNFIMKLGKTITFSEDFPAFIVNRILLPMINEAIYTLYEGVSGVEEIDTVMKLGMAHPMGPLQLADFIGLDVCLSILRVLHDGFGNPKYAPCPLLVNMVTAGKLGVKSGEGFYAYTPGAKDLVLAERFKR